MFPVELELESLEAAAAVEVEVAEEKTWAERDGCDLFWRDEGADLFRELRSVKGAVDGCSGPSLAIVDGLEACLVGALASFPLVVAGIEVVGGKRALGRGASKTVGRVLRLACVVD